MSKSDSHDDARYGWREALITSTGDLVTGHFDGAWQYAERAPGHFSMIVG